MKSEIPFVLLFCATYCFGQSYASTGRMLTLEELMDATVTISTGTEKTVAEAPSIATVITQEQIERSSATTLSDVLESVPGLYVYPSSVFYDSYDIRGIHTDYNPQTMLMINGTKIPLPYNGARMQRFNLPASLIQRIEVIKGPGSAVYGADAFSGIINVVTKNTDSPADTNEVGIRYGSYNSSEAYLHYKTAIGDGKIALNLSYMSNDNDKSRVFTTDLQSVFDKTFGTNASHAPAPLEMREKRLNIALSGVYEDFEINFWGSMGRDLGMGAGIAQAIDQWGHYDNDQAQLDIYHRSHFTNGIEWEKKLALSYFSQKGYYHIFPKGTTLPIGSDGNAFSEGGGMVHFPDGFLGNPAIKGYAASLENTLKLSFGQHNLRLSAGAVNTKENTYEKRNFGPSVIDGTAPVVNGALTDVSGTQYNFAPNTDSNVFFVSAQDEITLSKGWTITAGVRDDYYSNFGNTINPRLALVWHENPELSVKLLYGRAFRAPAVQELYTQNNPAALGNSDLKPEVMEMYEFGVDFVPFSNLHGSVNLYHYQASELISTAPAAVGMQFANVGKQSGRGVEALLQYQPQEGILLSADYAYRWTKDDITGKKAVGAPVHIGHLRADWEFVSNAILTWETQFVADIPRAENDPRQKIADYSVSNLSIGYDIDKQWSGKLAARNLFDKKYYYPTTNTSISDYPAPGRSVYAQISYRF